MSTRITLIATLGPLAGQEFVFTGYTFCLVGRSADCQLHLPADDVPSLTVSRRHCVLDIDPPRIRVRDLDSLNGTFINGKQIGRREKGSSSGATDLRESAEVELHDGDRLAVGNSEFLVEVQELPVAETPNALRGFWREEGVQEMNAPAEPRYDMCV